MSLCNLVLDKKKYSKELKLVLEEWLREPTLTVFHPFRVTGKKYQFVKRAGDDTTDRYPGDIQQELETVLETIGGDYEGVFGLVTKDSKTNVKKFYLFPDDSIMDIYHVFDFTRLFDGVSRYTPKDFEKVGKEVRYKEHILVGEERILDTNIRVDRPAADDLISKARTFYTMVAEALRVGYRIPRGSYCFYSVKFDEHNYRDVMVFEPAEKVNFSAIEEDKNVNYLERLLNGEFVRPLGLYLKRHGKWERVNVGEKLDELLETYITKIADDFFAGEDRSKDKNVFFLYTNDNTVIKSDTYHIEDTFNLTKSIEVVSKLLELGYRSGERFQFDKMTEVTKKCIGEVFTEWGGDLDYETYEETRRIHTAFTKILQDYEEPVSGKLIFYRDGEGDLLFTFNKDKEKNDV